MGAPSCIEMAPGTELATRSVHWLPATIEHSGAARVATFFEPLVEEAEEIDGRQLLRGGFRGRGLTGTEVKLPEGYTGHVLHPNNAASSTAAAGEERQLETKQGQEQQQRGWASAATFGGFVYWNHEARPLETDAQMRVMEWLPLAKQMHTPISPDEVTKRMAEGGSV